MHLRIETHFRKSFQRRLMIDDPHIGYFLDRMAALERGILDFSALVFELMGSTDFQDLEEPHTQAQPETQASRF
jgi:hypothetical protein